MANKPENSFKRYLVRIMGTRWDVQSHEDKYSAGVPDLSFGCQKVNGWIELKQIKAFKEDQPVKPDKYTPTQVNWLRKRNKHGGKCYVMVKIGLAYFLLAATMAGDVRRGMTKRQYEDRSIMWWDKSIDPDELAAILTR